MDTKIWLYCCTSGDYDNTISEEEAMDDASEMDGEGDTDAIAQGQGDNLASMMERL